MKPLRYSAVLWTAIGAAALTALVNTVLVNAGHSELHFSWMLGLVCLLVAAGAVWLGVQVARYRRVKTREKAPRMGPILAARTLAYAQGSILTGSLLTGVCAAIFGFHLAVAPARGLSVLFWQVVVNLVCSVVLLAAGLWAQHCCRIPPGEDDDDSSAGAVKPREGGTYAGS